MPRLLAAKAFPAYVDVYYRTTEQDPDSGATIDVWHYEDPFTYRCTFMSLKGHAEKFGATYAASDTVKLEVKPEDAQFINLSMRLGNLRMRLDDTNEYYKFVGNRSSESVDYYFNIDGMNPQVDNNGRIVCVEVYGKLV